MHYCYKSIYRHILYAACELRPMGQIHFLSACQNSDQPPNYRLNNALGLCPRVTRYHSFHWNGSFELSAILCYANLQAAKQLCLYGAT